MFPRKLKDFRLFNDANSYQGLCRQLTLPTIAHQFEDWRAGGMVGPIKIDWGLQAIDFEWRLGGHEGVVLRQMGMTRYDGALLRWIGAFQSDLDGSVTQLEVVVRGRHQQLQFGEKTIGEDSDLIVTTACANYQLYENGTEVMFIDMLAGIYRVGGVDRRAEINAALNG